MTPGALSHLEHGCNLAHILGHSPSSRGWLERSPSQAEEERYDALVLYLLYATQLRHVTSCYINRFQSASRIDMPF